MIGFMGEKLDCNYTPGTPIARTIVIVDTLYKYNMLFIIYFVRARARAH